MEDVVQDRKTLLSQRIRALEQAARTLPDGFIRALWEMPQGELAGIEELRLRLGFPMTVNLSGIERETNSPGVTAEDLHAVLENASQASAHTVLEQVRNGYVTLQGGHRMGLCGTVVRQGEEITTLRYLTSLTVRIACPVVGQAGEILRQLRQEKEFPSTLILAPPGTGKTTLLRELVRRLSSGVDGPPLRVGLADERGEVAALWQGVPQFDVGRHTDILDGCRKAQGLSILLRGMNPQVLAADEITDPADVRAVEEAAGCGVALLATAHGGSVTDLRRRPVYRALLDCGVFRRVVVMERRGTTRIARVEALS